MNTRSIEVPADAIAGRAAAGGTLSAKRHRGAGGGVEEVLKDFIGRSPDSLSLPERAAFAGKWIALERYTPATLPLRVIEALGDSPAACMRQLAARGLSPGNYEFVPIMPSV